MPSVFRQAPAYYPEEPGSSPAERWLGRRPYLRKGMRENTAYSQQKPHNDMWFRTLGYKTTIN